MTDDATYRLAVQRGDRLERKLDALTQQAKIWKQEADTQKATVHECYQACTGATGEPGDWNGANPVREVVAQRDLALAECERLKDLANKALDDLDAEAEAFESLENAQANFSSSRPEARAYGIAMVKASKSSKALRYAARAKP